MSDEVQLAYHRKYRPSRMSDYIGNKKLKDTVMAALRSKVLPQTILLEGASGCGKAQPLDSKVLTADHRFKRMGDIKIGDEVLTHNENIGKVTGIYPQGVRPIYRITLSDNTHIDVSDEHLNLVWGSDIAQLKSIAEPEVIVTTDEHSNSIWGSNVAQLKSKAEPEVIVTTDLIKRLESEDFYIYRHNESEINFINRTWGADVQVIAKIVSIKRVEDQECQCIMIDHPDHTYISDFFIPTHNTTFARLLVKEYRCSERDPYSGACDDCLSCKELEGYIETGDSSNLVDIKEVDIASEGGKKDVDAVLEEAMYPSYGGQWKIFIFDECHMATKQAQNRMLKIAEEPPENVLLIFCTTDPDMMLETLLNRCQLRLHVTKPEVKELGGLLKSVCLNENVDYDIKGVNLIANRSGLTIRRALILLQDIVNQKNSAKYDDVVDVLDDISESTMFEFYNKLIKKDTVGYVTLIHNIKVQTELKQFVDSILEFTKRGVLIVNGVNLDGMTDGELKSYKNLFGKFTVEQIGVLLEKLMSLRDGDIELKLLMMGYTGLTRGVSSNDSDTDFIDVQSQDNELVAEKEEHLRQTKKKFEVDEEAQQERVEELEQEMGIDSVLDLFGNVEVSDIPQ